MCDSWMKRKKKIDFEWIKKMKGKYFNRKSKTERLERMKIQSVHLFDWNEKSL